MNTTSHLLVSLAVAGGLLALTTPPVPAWYVVAFVVVVGVGIDLDHFPIARHRDGDWRALVHLIDRPLGPFVDPDPIFADSDIDGLDRLVSHLVLGGGVVVGLAAAEAYGPLAVGGYLGIAAGTSLYAHVLMDAVATARRYVLIEADESESPESTDFDDAGSR